MSVYFTQLPALVTPAQSPIAFTAYVTSSAIITSSSFQFVGELYYWQGNESASGSVPKYTLSKYPNQTGYGIFELSRIINSTLTDLAYTNPSNIVYYKLDTYWQYLNTTTNAYVTGGFTPMTSSFKALDGYQIFQEGIGDEIYTYSPYWPLMTSGPATQSVLIDDVGVAGVYYGTSAPGLTQPDRIRYTSNLGSVDYTLTGATTSSYGQVKQYPVAPGQSGFPLSTTGIEYYYVQAYNGSTPVSNAIKYEIVCQQKYPNVRIMWKNRYGQFDYYSFYMVNRKSFQTERKTYQPQLGTWNLNSLEYYKQDSSNLNYIADSKQSLQVNTWWLPESYNDIIKELLVSDEIYWVDGDTLSYVRPLTVATSTIQFKTGVVDGLIQYQFDFNYGQAYKLIL